MDKTQINLERMRANDADWEEQKHPRAKNGQFTSGSGSAGGASKPSAEPAAGSPLKKAAAAGMRKVNPEYIRKLESQLESKKRIYEQENKSSNPDVKYIKNIQNQINEIDSELSEIKKNNGYAKEETTEPAPKKAAASAEQSPLQKAAAAVKGNSNSRLQKDLAAVEDDPHEAAVILRERKAEIDRLTKELCRTKNSYRSQALYQEITRLKREYKEIDESI